MTLASVKIQFSFQHYFNPTEVPHEHPVPQGHSQCHTGPCFHFLRNVALTHLQLNKWSQDTSNLEALSIKVAYKCKIVHIPGDVWKSYYCHAGEMNNPKKAASSEQDPAVFSVCELGSWSGCSWGCKLSTASCKWCQGEVGELRREGKRRGPPGEGSLEAFMTESLIGK